MVASMQPGDAHRGQAHGEREGDAVARRPDGLEQATKAARPKPRRIGRGEREVTRSGRDRGRRDRRRDGDEIGEQVRTRSARLERRLGAGALGGAQIGVAGSERSHPCGVMGGMIRGVCRLIRFRHVLHQTTSAARWFPRGARSSVCIIASAVRARPAGEPRTARHRPRAARPTASGSETAPRPPRPSRHVRRVVASRTLAGARLVRHAATPRVAQPLEMPRRPSRATASALR